jgi:tetratricopeptide (TPR) repeat protein
MKQIVFIILLLPIMVWSQSDFDKAQKLFEQGKYTVAQPLFENYLKENPNHLKTIELLGDIHGSFKNWDQAIFYYEKLKKLKPAEANYFYKYGGALGMKAKTSNKFKALGMIDEVKASFEKAIILNPKHIEARWALVEMYLQLPGIIGGSESKAQKYANELMKISPIDGYLSSARIQEYFDRYTNAEKYFLKAIEISHSKIAYQRLANMYKNKMKQPEKAKALLLESDKNNK